MWHDPRDECKRAQARPDIVWEKEEDESKNGEVSEKSVSCERPAICRRIVLGLVEGAEQDSRWE